MAQKWILITGGSRGIGRALVTGLAQSWNVVFTGRDEEAMNATLAECENSTHRVRGYACDGNDESRVEQLAQTLLAERGAPEAIIHNAGIARDGLHIHQKRRALARGFGHQCDLNAELEPGAAAGDADAAARLHRDDVVGQRGKGQRRPDGVCRE